MKNNQSNTHKSILKRSKTEIVFLIAAVLGLAFFTLPVRALEGPDLDRVRDDRLLRLRIEKTLNQSHGYGELRAAELRAPVPLKKMAISAYNSFAWQTDATPCIGAQGTDICEIFATGENICAANFVPLGTILEVEGIGTCTVRDRMNQRYFYRVDWYMALDLQAARNFGVQYRKVSVYQD